MEDQRGDKPWYLTDRARWLAYVYLTQGESIRVDDVSDLDIGVDLLVRPGAGREEEDWKMGVVTHGVMSLPEETEETERGLRIPSSDLDLPSSSVLSDMPVLLAYYTMSDDKGYGALLLDDQKMALITEDEVLLAPSRAESGVRLFQLDNEIYRQLVDAELHRFITWWAGGGILASGSQEKNSGAPLTKTSKSDSQVVTSLFSTGTSQADE